VLIVVPGVVMACVEKGFGVCVEARGFGLVDLIVDCSAYLSEMMCACVYKHSQ
jgi:hypothetical protein